jgi:hypothetical protein
MPTFSVCQPSSEDKVHFSFQSFSFCKKTQKAVELQRRNGYHRGKLPFWKESGVVCETYQTF